MAILIGSPLFLKIPNIESPLSMRNQGPILTPANFARRAIPCTNACGSRFGIRSLQVAYSAAGRHKRRKNSAIADAYRRRRLAASARYSGAKNRSNKLFVLLESFYGRFDIEAYFASGTCVCVRR